MSVVQPSLPDDCLFTPQDYRATLAAAGYSQGFVELSPSQLKQSRSNSVATTASSSTTYSSNYPSSRWSVASSQAVLEEILGAALVAADSSDRLSVPTTPNLILHSPGSPPIASPRPLSLASSSKSSLLPKRSASPTPSFMSALSAGDLQRRRQLRKESQEKGRTTDPSVRRSVSPVVVTAGSTSSNSNAPVGRGRGHIKSRTMSPTPRAPGPPPTIPLPPTPTSPSIISFRTLTPPVGWPSKKSPTSPVYASRVRRSESVERQRAEARATLEGRPFLSPARSTAKLPF